MTGLSTNSLRVLEIIDGTAVDGPGLRKSVYLAGCCHRCRGCHNPQSWDFRAGSDMTVRQVLDRIIENDFNVTLSGGDPLYQLDAVLPLCREICRAGKTIWCYTGFIYEAICADTSLRRILDVVDVLVDGPFVASLRDTSLRFRGSSNQRIIDVKRSLVMQRDGTFVSWEG